MPHDQPMSAFQTLSRSSGKQVVDDLSEKERVLLRTVAFWLRGEMVSRLKDVSPAPDLLYDLAQSNFEVSCCALERVDMLASEGD